MHTGDLVALAACLVLAALVYLACLVLLDRRILNEARGVLARGL